jgi:hypothetical protein
MAFLLATGTDPPQYDINQLSPPSMNINQRSPPSKTSPPSMKVNQSTTERTGKSLDLPPFPPVRSCPCLQQAAAEGWLLLHARSPAALKLNGFGDR